MSRGGPSAYNQVLSVAFSRSMEFEIRECRMVSDFRSEFKATFRRYFGGQNMRNFFSIGPLRPRIGSRLPPRQVRRQKAKILIRKLYLGSQYENQNQNLKRRLLSWA